MTIKKRDAILSITMKTVKSSKRIRENGKKVLKVDLGERSYGIVIEDGVLSQVGEHLQKLKLSKKIGVVTNPTVGRLYAEPVMESLQSAGFTPIQFAVPDGEAYKSLESARDLYKKLLKEHFDRDSALVALGGGVIGDLTGFVAATFLRGIPFIQVPTSLESQVDASVGGKVAVDLPEGKNLVGCFYQPKAVVIDPTVLRSLPKRELSAGLSEVIKYGVIWDAKFFEFLEKKIKTVFQFDSETLQRIIYRSCEIKAEVVTQDETDKGLRNILNFGHTVGHAVETITGYEKFRHGEGVAVGMLAEALIARRLKMLDADSIKRLKRVTQAANLPIQIPKLNRTKLIEIMYHDKKVKEKRIRMILPTKIGKVKLVDNISWDIIDEALHQMMEGI